MKLEDVTTIGQLTDFLADTQAVVFSVLGDKDTCYRWIQSERVKFRYLTLSRKDRGVVIRHLMKVGNYSRQQTTRLIQQYRQTGTLKRRQRTLAGFAQKYTPEGISSCWRRWMSAMTRLVGRPSRSCASGPVSSLVKPAMGAWPPFR